MSDGIGQFVIGESAIGGVQPALGAAPTTLQNVIKAYLYQEYSDDADLQAFFAAYNALAQAYLNWFNNVNLPIYTALTVFGALLDWVGQGLYGYARPVLPSGRAQVEGPLNTYQFNTLQYNQRKLVGSPNYYATSDDVYRRCITWHFFKGDGKVFNVRWLKRRIMRFLAGANGVNYNVDQTYQVSVIFGADDQVNIRILTGVRRVSGGAFYNRAQYNTKRFNELDTSFMALSPLAFAAILQAAIDTGVLELPFQYTYIVTI